VASTLKECEALCKKVSLVWWLVLTLKELALRVRES
jgi:hypothetical protein